MEMQRTEECAGLEVYMLLLPVRGIEAFGQTGALQGYPWRSLMGDQNFEKFYL